jgi:hypothetical protein
MKIHSQAATVLEMPSAFSKFIYSFAVTLRKESPDREPCEENHALVKQLLKLSVEFSALKDYGLIDAALSRLEKASKPEQSLLLEIMGGSLSRFCL